MRNQKTFYRHATKKKYLKMIIKARDWEGTLIVDALLWIRRASTEFGGRALLFIWTQIIAMKETAKKGVPT
jgi:hypothetical protein